MAEQIAYRRDQTPAQIILAALEKAWQEGIMVGKNDMEKHIKAYTEQQPKAEPWTLESVKRIYWKSGLGGIRDAHNAAIGVKIQGNAVIYYDAEGGDTTK